MPDMLRNLPSESFVTCANSQSTVVRGTLMHITGQTAVFEVYSPFSILQLSEVLSDFEILIGERVIYSGRAVVRSLVNTGIMLVIETALVDALNAVDAISIVDDRSQDLCKLPATNLYQTACRTTITFDL
jgi:hypothetical protein